MKNLILLFTTLLIASSYVNAQDVNRLDENNGYRNLKFKSHVDSIEGHGTTLTAPNKYKVNNPAEYYIDGIRISKITLHTNSKGLIETINLFFDDEFKRLESIVRDNGKSMSNRQKAMDELNSLSDVGTPFNKFIKILRVEYGNATSSQNSIEIWNGKKVILTVKSFPSDGGGVMISLKELEKPKATNKFG